jgi:hypothetical protein
MDFWSSTTMSMQSWWTPHRISLLFVVGLLAISLYWHHETRRDLQRLCDLLSLYEIPRSLPEGARDEIEDVCAEPEPDPTGKGD